jgi:hypothetical protein
VPPFIQPSGDNARLVSGEHKANMIHFLGMARRPSHPSIERLGETELAEVCQAPCCLTRNELELFYRTHNARRYVMRLPSPKLIQELEQAWKELRSRRP